MLLLLLLEKMPGIWKAEDSLAAASVDSMVVVLADSPVIALATPSKLVAAAGLLEAEESLVVVLAGSLASGLVTR